MQTFSDKQKNALLRKFHALIAKTGVKPHEKEAMLSHFGVESSKDLTNHQLMDLCEILDKKANPKHAELDRWRKRVIAAIATYLTAMNREATMQAIKGTACRAAGCDFNKISLDRLRSIYNAFRQRGNDLKEANAITAEFLGKNTRKFDA